MQANQQSPVDFIADMGWGAVKSLSAMDEYRNLDRDIESNQKRWRKFVEADAPEKEKFPQVNLFTLHLVLKMCRFYVVKCNI